MPKRAWGQTPGAGRDSAIPLSYCGFSRLMMMGRSVFRSSLLLLALALALAPGPGRAADPAVARPSFPIDGEIQTKGTVFFIKAPGPAGAAAVGTAHTFDLEKLSRVRRGASGAGLCAAPCAPRWALSQWSAWPSACRTRA